MCRCRCVAVIARNDQLTMDRCIRSVFDDCPSVREVVVLDDASTDYTLDTAIEWAQKDARVSVYWQQRPKGLSACRSDALDLIRCTRPVVVTGDETFRRSRPTHGAPTARTRRVRIVAEAGDSTHTIVAR